MISRKRVLVVDDDRDFADALRLLLANAGYEVLVAYDGRDALRQARQAQPAAILVDVMMNERTEGFFTVQALRRMPETAATPIFVVSAVYAAVPDFQIPPDPRWTGHDVFIPKPIDPDALLARLRDVLARTAPASGPTEE